MSMQVFTARVKGGAIVPEEGVELPEGSRVKLSDSAFLKAVTEQGGSTSRSSGRGRAPRPSRKTKPKRSR